MAINRGSFVSTRLEEERANDKRTIFTVSLNEEEMALLKDCKRIIEQPKDSTALKTVFQIGANVLLAPQTSFIIGLIFKNKVNNQRTGRTEIE